MHCAVLFCAGLTEVGTPPGLLDAIAKAESGRRITGATTLQPWPWALNVDGRGLYFATREQAIAWTRKTLERGSNSTDVGCMQVDLQFHPRAFRTLEEAYDPETNADYAARFLVSLYESWVPIGLLPPACIILDRPIWPACIATR